MIYVISQEYFITGSNPKFIKNGFFVVKNVGILFLKIMTIPMVGQESQIDKESSEFNCKTNKIIRSFEFNSFELNRGLTNNYDLQTYFIKFTNKSNFLFFI